MVLMLGLVAMNDGFYFEVHPDGGYVVRTKGVFAELDQDVCLTDPAVPDYY
jgi:hypothetical protein